MMSREFHSGEEEPSELEVVCLEARRLIAEREILSPKSEVDEEFQFDIDCEDARYDYSPKLISQDFMNRNPFHFPIGGNGCFPLSKLDERI
ncbi:phosphatidylinositol 4-kinase gamma 7 [Nicotiana attenuata]|uniref:Phosphatidylinositol 4-kinase gamma 7 n=1 Tax=Nicotiana attenuata TaxID=49451 RepID=A0A1J6IT64_NICAT|nr:phosphatidylinositol 4-kinase gamma 7 [Nicotiana attenuata]